MQTKQSTEEKIPDHFAAFMCEVIELIDRGDEAATVESDDLLQYEHRAFGGLYDEANGRYGFECIVNDYNVDGFAICWQFDLDKQQIRDIADGNLTKLEMWQCEPDCGRRFHRNDYYCEECDFES